MSYGGLSAPDIPVAERIALAMEQSEGLSYALEPDEYRGFIYPFDTDADVHDFLDGPRPQSCCALAELACWRAADVPAPELSDPYVKHLGLAVSLLARIGARFGALRGPVWWPRDPPVRGSVVVLETPGLERSDAHAFGVVDATRNEAGEVVLESIDGGQGNGTVIARRRRVVRLDGRGVLRTYDPVTGAPGRPVLHWIQGALLG